jgi:hypothetical protein
VRNAHSVDLHVVHNSRYSHRCKALSRFTYAYRVPEDLPMEIAVSKYGISIFCNFAIALRAMVGIKGAKPE